MFPFTLSQLRILKAIATEKNFTKAAETLYLSQPSLSKQIKTLEENLDIQLIDRKDKRQFLTKNGKLLLGYAERILALCEESCRALIDLKNSERGILSIGTNLAIGTYLFQKILICCAQKYPQITLNFKIHPTPILVEQLQLGVLDMLIIDEEARNFFPDPSELIIKTFLYDNLNLVVSKSHPLAKKEIIEKNRVYSLNYITLSPTCSQGMQIMNLLKHYNINPTKLKSILELNSIESIKVAVNLGLGAAFVPASSTQKEINMELLKLIKIKDYQIVQKFYFVRNTNCKNSKAFEFFAGTLLKLKKEAMI